MAEKEDLTYCAAKGSRVWMKEGAKWREYNKTPKVACGRLVRVTDIGGMQNSMPLAILRVRGHEFGTHPKNLKLVGGSGFRSRRAIAEDIRKLQSRGILTGPRRKKGR